ncbi:MAG: calcium-binding protein, partial [Rhodobacterales bacterium]
MTVKLNAADLSFILRQIKISEAHSSGTALTDIWVDANGNVVPANTPGAVPALSDPHVPYGLRTVDGSLNNLVEGRETWGAADQPMPRLFDPNWRNDADGDQMPLGPPGGPLVTNNDYGVIGTATPGVNGGHSANVADADPRIISNLVVDQSISNPAAVEAWFANDAAIAAFHVRYGEDAIPVRPGDASAGTGSNIAIDNLDLASLPNIAPDDGISAPFNAWMTFFGQFFDHGLDLISKGDNGTVYIPLQSDDPLVLGADGIAGINPVSGLNDDLPYHLRFMAMTRSTPTAGPGADGVLGTADDTEHEGNNTTTPFVDQNQTYTSHASHQVFLRDYKMVDGEPVATGKLLDGENGGLPTWADVKKQALEKLGIQMSDIDVLNVPLLRTDPYGEFIRDDNGFAQVVVGLGPDGIPNTADDIVVSGTPENPVVLSSLNGGLGPVRTAHAFLDDIAHLAAPGGGKTA